MAQRSLCSRTKPAMMCLLALVLSVSLLSSTNARPGEYYTFTGAGNSMYPTIAPGDRVTIRFCVDGAQVNVGDIIAYSTIVTGIDTGYMLVSHRVIEKYREDDTWFFKTQGDNCPEPDWYEVPEYWLFGIVVDIEHIEHSEVQTKSSPQAELSQTKYPIPAFIQGFETVLLAAGILFASVAVSILFSRRTEQKNLLRNASHFSCYTCEHHMMQYIYQVQSICGRTRIRKIPDCARATSILFGSFKC